MMKRQVSEMQHERDMILKRVEHLEKTNQELKDLLEKKENEYNSKM